MRSVHQALGKNGGYTTTLKQMQVLTEKGLLVRNEGAHIYEPRASREQTRSWTLVHFLWQGSPIALAGSVKWKVGRLRLRSSRSGWCLRTPGRLSCGSPGPSHGSFSQSGVLLGLEVDPDTEAKKLANVISYGGARIAGTVRDDDGKSVEGMVTLIPKPAVPDRPRLYQVVETTEGGRFEIMGIRPESIASMHGRRSNPVRIWTRG